MTEAFFSPSDRAYMAEALQLAAQGLYTTTPNPRVGCILVKNNVIIGRGWHRKAGEPHAEVHALAEAGAAALGATAYVSLEPCAHQGRTPPCVDALIAAGVKEVVAAMSDPNPLVAGQGLARLEAAGIETRVGLLETEARDLNPGFISRMTRGRPWVRVKIAASLDGKTALANGESQWITGEAARQDGHRWRARACALLTGMGTVNQDDPRLNVRGVDTPRQPLKIVLDPRGELKPTARLFADDATVLVVTAARDPAWRAALEAVGAELLSLPPSPEGREDRIDLMALMQTLGERGINEVHVEAGRRLNGTLVMAGLADELLLYVAPCLLGEGAQGMFALPEVADLAARHAFAWKEIVQIGEALRCRLTGIGTDQSAT